MIYTLPYYNDYDVDLVSTDDCPKKTQYSDFFSAGDSIAGGGLRLEFSVTGNKVNFSVAEKAWIGSFNTFTHGFKIACGDFNLSFSLTSTDYMKVTGSYEGKVSGDADVYAKSWNNITCSFSQESDGLHVYFQSPYLTLNKVYPEMNIGNLIFSASDNICLKNILCAETDDYYSFFNSQRIKVDSIDNWTLNNDNKYVLTNVDKVGVIHLNQETIDKLLKDNDVIGCYLSVGTNKKGTKLKYLEFKVGETSNRVEVPDGQSKVVIPLTFSSPSDLQNITITARG